MSRFVHPEAQGDEVVVGNVYAVDFPNVGWKTKRLGKEPMDSNGLPLKGGSMRPVFASRAEIEAAGVPIPDRGAIDHRWYTRL